MNISYDNSVDAMYIKFKDGSFGSNKEVAKGIILDLSPEQEVLGIEILDASERFNLEDAFGSITLKMPFGSRSLQKEQVLSQ